VAVRELLALQASDWPFMVSREIAAPYARERFAGHRQALANALAAGEHADAAGVRNLAVHAERACLLDPS
jgi:1,4-alpha-glucan branching enzyme